ncbi:hypothetical protein [Marinobacter mangrovi]|uniref:hypothetical protein n=1 Tax=Marinobacter mangrovi TaxID=2803918 RepID=UPI0019331FB5|nr:hypothetical protein [Marinobacter mangrovi]
MTAAEATPSPLRELVSKDQWALPSATVNRTLQDALKAFVERVRQPNWLQDEPAGGQDELQPLSRRQLERWAPEPQWRSNLSGFVDALDHWCTRWSAIQPVGFVVAPPFTGLAESLEQVAADRDWRLIAPPDLDRIHRGQALQDWWSQFEGDTPWVLPELGHCWLRTPAGLALVRHLLGAIAAGELGRGLVGCNSWSWTFWTHLLPELRFSTLTLQALDHQRLGLWLQGLAGTGQFRLTTNGSWVVPPKDEPARNGARTSAFLRDLAAWSRGIPEVAWAIWRDSLRARPEAEVEEPPDAEPTQSTCWVIPWSQVSVPTMPPGESRPLAFVLHALLLHQGLDETYLQQTTGLAPDDVHIALHSLHRAELIGPHPRGWFVTPRGYPAVRRYLHAEGFAVDGF